MLYTLLHGAAAVRRRRAHRALHHARCDGASRCSGTRSRRSSTRCPPHVVLRSGQRARRSELPAEAVAHRRRIGWLVRRRLRRGAAAVRLRAVSLQRLHRRATSARSGDSSASARVTLAFAALRAARIPHRAPGPVAVSAARRGRSDLHHGAHGVPAYRCRDRTAADDGTDAAVRLVRALESRADDVAHGHAGEHRQRARSA